MSILVEQVPPAGLLLLPALGMASGTSVAVPKPLPTVHLSEPFPIHHWQRAPPPHRVQSLMHGLAINLNQARELLLTHIHSFIHSEKLHELQLFPRPCYTCREIATNKTKKSLLLANLCSSGSWFLPTYQAQFFSTCRGQEFCRNGVRRRKKADQPSCLTLFWGYYSGNESFPCFHCRFLFCWRFPCCLSS